MRADPIEEYVITPHGAIQLRRRGISEDILRRVVERPEQRYAVRPGRDVLQSQVSLGTPPRRYLVRVFVDVDRKPPEVVTAYRTRKIDK